MQTQTSERAVEPCNIKQHGKGVVGESRLFCALACLVCLWAGEFELRAQGKQPEARLLDYRGKVHWVRHDYEDNVPGTNLPLEVGDSVHTFEDSMAVVWLRNNNSSTKLGESTILRIETPQSDSSPLLRLFQGALYFFSREKSREAQIITPHGTGAPRGTEFVITVQSNLTLLAMLDGTAILTNVWGTTNLAAGELGIAMDGKPPFTMRLMATNTVQWWLYYPGVLDAQELNFSTAEKETWKASLEAYQSGDLLHALFAVPGFTNGPSASTDAQRVYLAGLFLAAGQVDKTEFWLKQLSQDSSLAAALRWVIAAVQLSPDRPTGDLTSASEWLGVSYYYQAQNEPHRLEHALSAARTAVEKSPDFAFGWERVAELEFGFGHITEAKDALNRSLALAPKNAQAHALYGFLLSSENRLREARSAFEESIRLDSGLGNAWLGRGLVRIRSGDLENGRMDLQTAAVLEPNRSLLRSYLGKAYGDSGADTKAKLEFERAMRLDPNDPTPGLYAALLNQQENRINEAIDDLENSQKLNDNRSLFRSKLLLDEDRAVRSVNLASIYRDDGMVDVSVREAGSAVTSDYANYSAHLFLANSYNELRDPNLINLRYETATISEYLIANLLAPVGGSQLSSFVSQQEYSRLFEREGPGFSSETTYLSRGDWQEQASQYGWFKDTGYSVDAYYRSQNGFRPNNDLEQAAVSVELKQQFTPQDSVYLQAISSTYESGDVRQLYDQNAADRNLRMNEDQIPNLFLGYHHEWAPGMHTLLLAGRLEDRFSLDTENLDIPGIIRDGSGNVAYRIGVTPGTGIDKFQSLQFHSSFWAYSTELQQIAQVSEHTLIAGVRYQTGETQNRSEEIRPGNYTPPYTAGDFISVQDFSSDLTRLSFYGYDQWHILNPVWLTAGVSYDTLHFPRNVQNAPISDQDRTSARISPKVGFIWMPAAGTTFRGAFTRSLGGLFYDSSVRLEPVQIAGFDQAYRSLIPESYAGAIPGSKFQTFDLGVEQRFKSRTYLVAQLELLQSDATEDVGAFDFDASGLRDAIPTQLSQTFKYEERSLSVSLNQLVGTDFAFGARYRLSDADLRTHYPGLPETLFPDAHNRALMHTVDFYGIFNHPCGFFAEADALWRGQSNYDYNPGLPGDSFWQFNVSGGYRFFHRRAELSVALLNLLSRDYHLNPLSFYQELPRERTLVVNLKLNF